MSNNSSAKTTQGKLQNIKSNGSDSCSETDSTASSTSIANEKRSSSMRIEDVPVVDLSKVEFLEKLGEGKSCLNHHNAIYRCFR